MSYLLLGKIYYIYLRFGWLFNILILLFYLHYFINSGDVLLCDSGDHIHEIVNDGNTDDRVNTNQDHSSDIPPFVSPLAKPSLFHRFKIRILKVWDRVVEHQKKVEDKYLKRRSERDAFYKDWVSRRRAADNVEYEQRQARFRRYLASKKEGK